MSWMTIRQVSNANKFKRVGVHTAPDFIDRLAIYADEDGQVTILTKNITRALEQLIITTFSKLHKTRTVKIIGDHKTKELILPKLIG